MFTGVFTTFSTASNGYFNPMPRPIWSGTINFGLVSVPVRMFSATESKELRFHFVHKDDLVPIGYDKVRKDTGKHVDDEDIVRAFEIAKVVIRKKEHLACLRAYDGTLVLETMYYADEVRNPERLKKREDGRKASVRKEEIEMAKSLVESLSASFKPDKYDDDYRKELLKLIRDKAKGKKLPEPEPEEKGEVIDLMAALRESVKQSKRKEAPRASGRSRARK